MRNLLLASAAIAALAFSLPASAVEITNGSAAFDAAIAIPSTLLNNAPAGTPSPTAAAHFANFAFNYDLGTDSTLVTLDLTLANNTDPSFASARLTGFGFDTDPTIASASGNSSVFQVYTNKNFPAFGKVDLCLSSGSTCAGGGNGGLLPGAKNTVALALSLAGNVSKLDLGYLAPSYEGFDWKFQTDYGSVEAQSLYHDPNAVPEPGTIALLGVGLLGLGFIRARHA